MCIRRGEWNKSRSGGRSRCPDKGLIVIGVGESDQGRFLGGGSVHV